MTKSGDPSIGRVLPSAHDRFEEWLHTPVSDPPNDPRFEVRRADPAEFDGIFDLLDIVFGARPRTVYDWLYRRNPLGLARCWVVAERQSGRLVGTGARWPWPIARGGEALDGRMVGDVAIAPEWQRQGVAELRTQARLRHPMTPREATLGWSNEHSVARSLRYGRAAELLGPVAEGVLRLRSGRIARLLSRLRHGAGSALRIEDVSRFDDAFDPVTERCMSWDEFWCPHAAGFLNWRYADHPTRGYRSLTAFSGDTLAGYAVVRAEGRTALLMELVAAAGSGAARALVAAACDAAAEAGCRWVAFHAPPRFRHWPLLRAMGFAEREGRRYMFVDIPSVTGTGDLDHWQLVPGDADAD